MTKQRTMGFATTGPGNGGQGGGADARETSRGSVRARASREVPEMTQDSYDVFVYINTNKRFDGESVFDDFLGHGQKK